MLFKEKYCRCTKGGREKISQIFSRPPFVHLQYVWGPFHGLERRSRRSSLKPMQGPPYATDEPNKPDKALQGLLQDPVLSESSKLTYAQRLKAISTKLGQPICELVMQPMAILPWIKQRYPEVATQKNVVTAVLAALKRMPAVKDQYPQALAIWLRASKELEAQQQARLKANEPSARQQRGYVELQRVDQGTYRSSQGITSTPPTSLLHHDSATALRSQPGGPPAVPCICSHHITG